MDNTTIIIDGYFLKTQRGVGLHLRNFLMELQKSSRHKFVLLIPENAKSHVVASNNLDVISIKQGNNIIMWYNVIIPFYSYKFNSRINLFPANMIPFVPIKGLKIITLHDVIFLSEKVFDFKRRSLYQNFGRLFLRIIYRFCSIKNNRYITVSNHSKSQIKFYLPKVTPTVIYQGPGQYFLNYKEIKNDTTLKNIVCFSSIDDRKNTQLAIDVFIKSKLYEKGYQLVLCGDVKKVSYVNHTIIVNPFYRIKLKERPSEELVTELLCDAACFLFLSEDEGFGLPIVEVSRLGVPVICSNRGATAEIGKEIAYLVDIDNEEHIVDELIRICSNSLKPKQSPCEIDDAYNWENYVNQYLKLIDCIDTVND